MVTVIFGHPWHKSFNYAILETVQAVLVSQNKKYQLIDLYADGFDPAVRVEDLALYGVGKTNDPLARKYMEILSHTDEAIFIYHLLWGIEPAIVKGFYDKVFLKDFAWKYSEDGKLLPLLNVPKVKIFSTSDSPTSLFASYFQDYLPSHVFMAVGLGKPEWLNLDNIPRRSRKECGDFLTQVAKATIA